MESWLSLGTNEEMTLPCLGPSVATTTTTFLPFELPKNALPFVAPTLQGAVFVGLVKIGVATSLIDALHGRLVQRSHSLDPFHNRRLKKRGL